jgi:hypothetical protein
MNVMVKYSRNASKTLLYQILAKFREQGKAGINTLMGEETSVDERDRGLLIKVKST